LSCRGRIGNRLSCAGRRPTRQVRAPGDQAGAALVGNVRPRPLDKYQDPIAKADKEEDVNKEPRKPGNEPRDMDLPKLRDTRGPPNRRQAALVPIMKRFAGAR